MRALGEVRVPEPRGQRQGPHRRGDGAGRGAERPPQRRRHFDRAHLGEHRHRTRAGGRRPGLPLHHLHAGEDVQGEGGRPARPGGGDHPDADRGGVGRPGVPHQRGPAAQRGDPQQPHPRPVHEPVQPAGPLLRDGRGDPGGAGRPRGHGGGGRRDRRHHHRHRQEAAGAVPRRDCRRRRPEGLHPGAACGAEPAGGRQALPGRGHRLRLCPQRPGPRRGGRVAQDGGRGLVQDGPPPHPGGGAPLRGLVRLGHVGGRPSGQAAEARAEVRGGPGGQHPELHDQAPGGYTLRRRERAETDTAPSPTIGSSSRATPTS